MKTGATVVLLTAILLVLVSIHLMLRKREYFAIPIASNQVIPQKNQSDLVWERHEIQDSYDLDYPVQPTTAYYNEMRNAEFQEALLLTFKDAMLLPNGAEWSPESPVDREHVPPEAVTAGYMRLVPWLEDRLRASPHFRMPGDGADPAPFQVIHDHWMGWSKSTIHPDRYLHRLEVLIYREAKYHAKHVVLRMVTEDSQVLGILEVQVAGIVFEDSFGLFPVLHSDNTDLQYPQMVMPDNPLVSYPALLDATAAQEIVDRRAKQTARVEKINKMYEVMSG